MIGGLLLLLGIGWLENGGLNHIFRIMGGGIIFSIAIYIIGWIVGDNDAKASNVIGGIYLLGSLFAAVLSLVKFGLSSWIVLHASLSWVMVVLFIK